MKKFEWILPVILMLLGILCMFVSASSFRSDWMAVAVRFIRCIIVGGGAVFVIYILIGLFRKK